MISRFCDGYLLYEPVTDEAFARALDERAGVVSAHVTTARPVSHQAQENLRARLTLLTGRNNAWGCPSTQ